MACENHDPQSLHFSSAKSVKPEIDWEKNSNDRNKHSLNKSKLTRVSKPNNEKLIVEAKNNQMKSGIVPQSSLSVELKRSHQLEYEDSD